MELEFLPQKKWMLQALALAREAGTQGEVPVGALVVRGEEILGQGRNRREAAHSALAHAEVEALHQACQRLGDWRLTGCQLYVTLEPCPMCLGAAVNARVERIIYGADSETAWNWGGLVAMSGGRPKVYRGFMEAESRALLRSFFEARR